MPRTDLLIPSAPPIWDRIYTYAWFVTFALAFVIYGVLMFSNASVREEALTADERG